MELDDDNDDLSDESWRPSTCHNSRNDDNMQEDQHDKESVASSLSLFSKERETGVEEECCFELPKEKSTNENKRRCSTGKECPTLSVTSRRKINCPLPSCKSEIVHLPRHMRNVHKWTKKAAAKVLSKYNIRKQGATKQSKDYHLRRRCPVGGCFSIVQRLSTHLQNVHKMEKTSKEYCDAIKTSKVVPKGKHPIINWKEQRAQNIHTPLNTIAKSRVHERDTVVQPEVHDSSSKVAAYPVLRQFEIWLQTPDGGKRDSKTAKQHSSQLVGLLNAIDHTSDINSLLDINLVSSLFLESYAKKKNYEAGTTKSYLMSLRHFYTFLISDNPDDVNFNADDVRAAREKIRLWSTSYKRETCTRRWKKLAEDESNRLQPADIKTFENSEAAREAIKTIGEFSGLDRNQLVTQAQYTLVRDFLFAQILIDNANRPGVLSCMTMEEFNNMHEKGDRYVISVMKHKTVHIHGPALIVLSEKLKAWLILFVKMMRPHVTSTSDLVFLTWNGQPMTSSQINKALQSVFKKATVSTKITSTSFRKAAVTNMHENSPEMSSKLASLMAHNEATAKKYYLLTERTRASIEASQRLARLMRAEPNTGETKSGKSASSVGDKETSLNLTKRVPWTNEEVDKIKKFFGEEIQQRSVSLAAVRAKVNSHDELKDMPARRVYDKLKKDLFNDESLQPNVSCELPIECESLQDRVERIVGHSGTFSEPSLSCEQPSSVSVVTPTERAQGIFSEEGVANIKAIFSDMIQLNKSISKDEIKKRCLKTEKGKKLLQELKVPQLVNRIKYERKKKRQMQE